MLCPRADRALLAFEGPDAESFLQGQLSNDLHTLGAVDWQRSTYNSPKGRVLASLLIWRSAAGFLADVCLDIAQNVQRRLSMYILRSKVQARLVTGDYVRIGLGGPGSRDVLRQVGLELPNNEPSVIRGQGFTLSGAEVSAVYVLVLDHDRVELLLENADHAALLRRSLHRLGASFATDDAWRWLNIRSGIVDIEAAIQDQFVAQMLNYELIGAVSFKKGCYPGQEIVARTQYRGQVKRRTFLAHCAAGVELRARDPIYADGPDEQAVGSVLNLAPSPQGGHDLLACMHQDSAKAAALHLNRRDGPEIQILPLPYRIPAA
jgi:hypothetical protein